jgi:predicted CopG family antitoxin
MSEVETLVTKQIRVREETYAELTDLGKKNETYDEIIWRLIQNYKKTKVNK